MSGSKPRTIAVYKESPLWSKYDRWFHMPLWELERLHVATYAIGGPGDQPSAHEIGRAAAGIRADHPDCVLVY